jgi:hypothetical protein
MFMIAAAFIAPPMAPFRSGPIMGGCIRRSKNSLGAYTL